MTTITLKINEKSTAGKTFLAFIKMFIAKEKSVEIVKTPNSETIKAIEDVEKGIGLTRVKNSSDLFKQLGI